MLKEKILSDLKTSMKARDETRTSVLRLLLAAIKNKELEYRVKTKKVEELNDEETLKVIHREMKKRQEAATLYKEGKRDELAVKEEREAVILERYLPPQLDDEELVEIVGEVINRVLPGGMKDFGKVMGEAMKAASGRVEAARVSEMIKQLIGGK